MAEGEYSLVVQDFCRKSMVHLNGLSGRSWSAMELLFSGWALGWDRSSVFNTGRDGYLFFLFVFFFLTSILHSDRRFVLNSFGMFDIGYNRCTFLLASSTLATMRDYVCVNCGQAMREPRELYWPT